MTVAHFYDRQHKKYLDPPMEIVHQLNLKFPKTALHEFCKKIFKFKNIFKTIILTNVYSVANL